jgi:SagB-type dehydrogenase family enzyme
MDAFRTVFAYHERSKHRLDRYAPGPGYLDWASQPDPFRTYEGAPRVALPLLADGLDARYCAVRAGVLPAPAAFTLDSIGTLFELSFAISAWKAYAGSKWALRCNPSSGNLHPTEAYLLTGAIPSLDAGVYHYLSREHVLEQRVRHDAGALDPQGGVVLGLASIYWREAWKYGMRAFRYCQHDCGHAIAAVSYAAATLGWQTRLLHEAGDEQIAQLLGLAQANDETERERPDCLLWVGTSEPPSVDVRLATVASSTWIGQPNRLSPSHVDWPDIELAHAATVKPPTPPHPEAVAPSRPIAFAPRLDLPMATIIRQRRSAVDFDAVTSITDEAFYAMLEVLLPDRSRAPWNAWPAPVGVHLALFLHRVEGLEPGLYVYLRDAAALDTLQPSLHRGWQWQKIGPVHLPLYLLLPYDTRDAARTISCHQYIAADSCFSLGMLASFAGLEDEPWRYRSLYRECGMIGQALYLEAEAAGIRATGIGCFFDDEMHRLLGLGGTAWQSLYHFTVGGPVEDRRLTTLPPYPGSSALSTS